MATLVPNPLDADRFAIQAAVDESGIDGERFTWRRFPTGEASGMVVSAEPGFDYPRDPPGDGSLQAAIDSVASADDFQAWASAALAWIDYAETQYAGAREVWKQLEWGGAVSPDDLPPNRTSLVNGRSFGALELLAAPGLKPVDGLQVDTWPAYFASLRAALPGMTVSQAVSTQIAMRSTAWTMQSLAALGDSGGPAPPAHICELAHAWRASSTLDCQVVEDKPLDRGSLWGVALGAVAVVGLVWWLFGSTRGMR